MTELPATPSDTLSNRAPAPTQPKRLCLFFDGAWNDPSCNTNVWRMRLMLAERTPEGMEQRVYYDHGKGIYWRDLVTGTMYNQKLERSICAAYSWLTANYDDGDEVFLFGFSRGAFVARTLCAVISRCGLVRPGSPLPVDQVFERYQRGARARAIYDLAHEHSRTQRPPADIEDRWLIQYSRRIQIKFLGVWDTVGAMGVPVPFEIPGFPTRGPRFHSPRIERIVSNAYAALAIDEHRRTHVAPLWRRYTPDDESEQAKAAGAARARTQRVEQRWFAGCHANVGGGYRNDQIAQIPLHWMQQKALDCGLAFRSLVKLEGDEHLAPLCDSYTHFLNGYWRLLPWEHRHHRRIAAHRIRIKDGWSQTINETIDESVFRRIAAYPEYRPPSVLEWAKRTHHKLPIPEPTVSTDGLLQHA